MKERPINMRAEEVRAILAGRKTQFRRVVKWPLLSKSDGTKQRMIVEADAPLLVEILKENIRRHPHLQFSQLGAPGDRLWVREATWHRFDGVDASTMTGYVADGGPVRSGQHREAMIDQGPHYKVPSIHMPRKFSRITLEVTGVRVQRLQDISEKDAKAEGVIETFRPAIDPMGLANNYYVEFARLWRSINGPRSWDANPWVRAVEFRRLEGAQ